MCKAKNFLIQNACCLLRPIQLMCGTLSNLYGFSCVSLHLLISATASFIRHTFIWDEMLEFPHSLIRSSGIAICNVTIMSLVALV